MSTSGTTATVPGFYGAQAAELYKQVPAHARKSTPVQYTSDFQGPEAQNDLFAYTQAFDADHNNEFTAEEIANATGLDLNAALNGQPEKILKLWDLNNDSKVDTVEAATGLLAIDDALDDGTVANRPNGTLTQAKREATEEVLRAFVQLEQEKQARFQQVVMNPFSLYSDMTAQDRTVLQDVNNTLAQLDPGGFANLTNSLVGSATNGPFSFPAQINKLYEGFKAPLRMIQQAVGIQAGYQNFQQQ